MSKSKELREQLASTASKMAELVTTAKKSESGLMNAEQRQVFDKYNADVDRLKDELESYDRMEKFENALMEDARKPVNRISAIQYRDSEDFLSWVKAKAGLIDPQDMTPELQSNSFVSRYRKNQPAYLGNKWQERANEPQTISLNSGNFGSQIVPVTLADFVTRFQSKVWDVRSICRNIVTEGNGTFDIPVINDTANEATLIAETTADAVTPVGTTKVSLGAYCYTSGMLQISKEMLKSSEYDAISFFGEDLAQRIARGRAKSLCQGGDTTEPLGYMTGASTTGVTLASNSAITLVEILSALHAVPLHYRANASWVLSDSLCQAVRSLVDDNGRPIWSINPYPTAAAPFAETLFGRPVYVDPYLSAMGANDRTVGVIGDFDQFVVRSVNPPVEVAVSEHRYFEKRAVALVSYFWHDSLMLQAGAFRRIRTIAT